MGFNVEEEEDKMQSAGLRKIKKTCKAAMDATGRKVALTCHMVSLSDRFYSVIDLKVTDFWLTPIVMRPEAPTPARASSTWLRL